MKPANEVVLLARSRMTATTAVSSETEHPLWIATHPTAIAQQIELLRLSLVDHKRLVQLHSSSCSEHTPTLGRHDDLNHTFSKKKRDSRPVTPLPLSGSIICDMRKAYRKKFSEVIAPDSLTFEKVCGARPCRSARKESHSTDGR